MTDTRIHPLGEYRGYELTASEDRFGHFTGCAERASERTPGSSTDGLVFSVGRQSLEEVEVRLRELVDEALGPKLDETDVDLTARLQRLRRDD